MILSKSQYKNQYLKIYYIGFLLLAANNWKIKFKKIQFTIASKMIKHLGIPLAKMCKTSILKTTKYTEIKIKT